MRGYCVAKDAAPDSIVREVKLDCASVVVASFWGEATAAAWLEGDCHVDTPAACESCCLENNAAHGGACDCGVCVRDVNLKTHATAEVLINTKVANNTASCTKTVAQVIDGVVQEVQVMVSKAVRPGCLTISGGASCPILQCMRPPVTLMCTFKLQRH